MAEKSITPEAAVKFLREAARYFSERPTSGEDVAFWANVYNAETCGKIADLLDTPTLTTLEREVVTAAVTWHRAIGWNHTGACGRELGIACRLCDLAAPIRALLDASTPKGVKPSEGWYWLRKPNSPHTYENDWRPVHLSEDEPLMSGWELGPRIPLPLDPQE